MKVLVTGAAGFIGSHFAEALLREGEGVVCLDSLDPFYDPAVKERNLEALRAFGAFEEVRGDVRDPAAWAALPDGIGAVVHLAARAGVRPSMADPALYADVNVTGTARMLAFAHARGDLPVVLGSSSSVYGESHLVPFAEDQPADAPVSPYAATKRAAELLCRAAWESHAAPVVVTRLFTVYGPRQRPDLAIHRFARLMEQRRPIPRYGDGSSARDYTHVADVAAGLRAALAWVAGRPASFEVVNLGSDRPVELNDLIRTLGEELGVEPRIEALPPQPGDVTRTWADLTHARALLGYEPRVGFREGIRDFVRWLRGSGQDAPGP